MGARQQKKELKELLATDGWRDGVTQQLQALPGVEAKVLLGSLFSFLLLDGVVRWRAATSIGLVVAQMYDHDADEGPSGPEQAKDIIRRLMWNLNEESGNVAWGAPEAFSECLAHHAKLAETFHNILISYIDDTIHHGLWLELPMLRRGAVWGVANMCCKRPEMMGRAVRPLLVSLEDCEDPQIPGLAAWGLGCLGQHAGKAPIRQQLQGLCGSPVPVSLYVDGELTETTAGALAEGALVRLG